MKEEDDPLFVKPAKKVAISEYSSILQTKGAIKVKDQEK